MWDDSPSGSTRGESLIYAKERRDEVSSWMLDIWNRALPHLGTRSRFKIMMNEHMETIIERYTNVSNPPFTFDEKVHAKKATVAEKVCVEGRDDLYRMFYLGGLIRTFDVELEAGGSEALSGLRDEVYGKL